MVLDGWPSFTETLPAHMEGSVTDLVHCLERGLANYPNER